MKKTYITPSIQVISLDMESSYLLTTSPGTVSFGSDDDTIDEGNFSQKILSTGHNSWKSADDDDDEDF